MAVANSKRAWLVGSLAAVALGCGGGGNAYSLPVGSDDASGGAFLGDDASSTGALDAHIEENHLTITIVTLSCAGDCADVVAVATGGHPPYTFAWDDGSTSASRMVCPTASTSYAVKVTDTGSSGELARAAQTVQVPLTADVLACPDGGAAPGPCDRLADSTTPGRANPSGAWSYGWSQSLGATFTLHTEFILSPQTNQATFPGIDAWTSGVEGIEVNPATYVKSVINCCLRAFSIAAAAALCWSAQAGRRNDRQAQAGRKRCGSPTATTRRRFRSPNSIGEPAGFMIDLCRSVAKNMATGLNLGELKVDYVLVTAANRFDAIQSGKADLLCEPTSATLSRREQVDFSIATFVDGASLLVSGEGPGEFGALAGKKIGILAGTTTEQSLRDTLASANINAEVVPAKTHDEGLAMLDQGTIVAYFGDRAILAYLASKSSAPGKLHSPTTISRSSPTLWR